MTASSPLSTPPVLPAPVRIRVFIDYWNFQLTLNERSNDSRFQIDWLKLPAVLVEAAASTMQLHQHSYEGSSVFTSYDPRTKEGRKYRSWVTNWLDRQSGIQVKCFERRAKHAPKCQACHAAIETCPNCHERMAGTIEKGVDTSIATDMIRLAWENAYDVAILASADADLVPAVEFIDLKGKRVLQAGFPPHGSHLSRACWATIDIALLYQQFRRR